MSLADPHALTWNFFQRANEPDLWCAVPAHTCVPKFLLSGEWQFSGHRCGRENHPPGFKTDVAIQSDALNGFYLFQLISAGLEGAASLPCD